MNYEVRVFPKIAEMIDVESFHLLLTDDFVFLNYVFRVSTTNTTGAI